MKKGMNIHISFTNRAIYTFIVLVVFLVIGVTVFAFGTSSPSTFGHSAGELDLSGGIDGDVVFRGNVDVAGDLNVTQRLDVVGDLGVVGSINVAEGIKIGAAITCDANTGGSLRYNSVDKVMEYCNSSSWNEMGRVSGENDTLPAIYSCPRTTSGCSTYDNNCHGQLSLSSTCTFKSGGRSKCATFQTRACERIN